MTTSTWILSSLLGAISLGLLLAWVKFKLAKIDMTFFEFTHRLLRGGGYKNVSPSEFDDLIWSSNSSIQIVDLRDKKSSEAKPVPGSISSPFDDLLKEVAVEKRYDPNNPIVLVCDTGQMSRVAANILVEDEAFIEVYNLRGGVAAWKKWQQRARRRSSCCTIGRAAAWCG